MSASPFAFREFLTAIRMEAANDIAGYVSGLAVDWLPPDERPDPADVHEDVREALWPLFERIRERVEGPLCNFPVPIGTNAAAYCDRLAGHDGEHHPCVGRAVTAE